MAWVRFGVGLWCLQSTALAPRHHVRAYRELREDARLAERLGFDSVWLSEHHFFYDGYCPALLPAAAGVLAVTERLRVATGMLLAPLQRPERLVAAATELAARSGGRLDLGLGLGYREVELDGKGVHRGQRVARLAAALDLLESAGGPPVWIGSATPAGVARAAARGHGVLLSGANPLPMVRELAAAHRDAFRAAGRPEGSRPRVAALRNVWVLDDEAERAQVLDWFRASYLLYAGLGWTVAAGRDHPGMDFVRAREQALEAAVATAIVGEADQVVEGLREVAAAGVDDVVFRVVLEGCPRPALHTVLERLADREPQAARLADDHGLFGVLVEGGQAGHEAVVAGQVAAVTEAVRPLRHAGRRWRVPAGLDGHATLEAVSVTPKPAQVDLPVWLGGAAAAALAATTGLAKVVTELADARPERLVQPAAARLAGELEADRAAVLAWAGAGATHLLLRLPDGAPLDAAVATVSRHLAPEVAMPHFPRLLAEG